MGLYNEKEFLEVCEDLGIELVDRTSEEGQEILNNIPTSPDEIKELFLFK